MKTLLAIAQRIDKLNEKLALCANGFVLLACLISAGNAFARYGFNLSSNAWLEIQWYLFAYIVMLGAAHTLRRNEHVRVDIVYGSLSTRAQVWTDVLGGILFLLPAMGVLIWTSWPFFLESYRIGETSHSAGGLLRWPVKIALPLGFVLVLMQGVSEIIKRIAYLRGRYNMDIHYDRPLQ